MTAAGVRLRVQGVGGYFWGRGEQRGARVSVLRGAQRACAGLRVRRGAARARGVSGKEGAARVCKLLRA